MKISPLSHAFLYLGLGILFTYIAIQSAEETVFNFITMLLAFFATIDFVVATRLFNLHFRIKKANRKKDK
ncbi:YdiK family protein [Gracilibacillus sp. YIM 98692]|uniref:YdiK family protein n=1 Tax=Gracilibacillus sp. YIM 98692 TaxID=2663532 RepID=UPI0013D1A808|nr:YdiK family protein [Gracilibacillus sp. YIM 98692]